MSFGAREHRRLFSDIAAIRLAAPTLRGEALINTVAVRSADYGFNRRSVALLRIDCPNPDHILGYARLVKAGWFRRQIAIRAAEFATEIERTPPDERPRNATELADALARQARNFAPLTETEPGRSTRAIGQARVPQPGESIDARARREDTLLADLLQSPRQAGLVSRILPVESFQDPQRREVYFTILNLTEHGESVDAVIVASTMAHQRAVARSHGAPVDQRPVPAEPDDVYLDRLSRTFVSSVTAVDMARSLFAEDLRKNRPWNGPAAAALNPDRDPSRPALRPANRPMDPTLSRPVPRPQPGPAPQRGR